MSLFYKVVNEDLTSCCRNPNFPLKYKVRYKIGEFVKPNIDGTRLFVFKNLDDVNEFLSNVFLEKEFWSVYECEVTNPKEESAIAYPAEVESFWYYRNAGKLYGELDNSMPAPQGTYSCDSVKLIKRIEV